MTVIIKKLVLQIMESSLPYFQISQQNILQQGPI